MLPLLHLVSASVPADHAAVRGVLDELLLQRPNTDWHGFAHLRELSRRIMRDLSLRECWE